MSSRLQCTYAPAPNTERGRPCRIHANQAGTKIVYCSGTSVVMRDIQNPMLCELYQGHQNPTTVAKWAPSGAWVCSADNHGRVLVWDTLNPYERILRLEKKSCQNGVYDMAWSEDSQRICVVGLGKECSSEVFFWDSGASVGDLMGHSGPVLACAIRPQRPYRLATGGEDRHVNFYKGPPFSYLQTNSQHTNFINAIEFSPNAQFFISVGSDRKGLIFDGKTGAPVLELHGEGMHTAAIYGVAWSPDSAQLLTASGDKTAKLWDAATGTCTHTFAPPPQADLGDIQLGCLWSRDIMMTVNLRGDLQYLDPRAPSPVRVLRGHNTTASALTVHTPTSTFHSSDINGHIVSSQFDAGAVSAPVRDPAPTVALAVSSDGASLCSCTVDGNVHIKPVASAPNPCPPVSFALPEPRAVAADPASPAFFVMAARAIVAVVGGQQVCTLPTAYRPTCIAAGGPSRVVVGGDDAFFHLLEWHPADSALVEIGTAQGQNYKGVPTAVALSADGARFAAALGTKILVFVWDSKTVEMDTWLYHTADVTSLAWSPDGTHLISSGKQPHVFVWTLGERYNHITFVAHPLSVVSSVWIDNTTVLTLGSDLAVKKWTIAFAQ